MEDVVRIAIIGGYVGLGLVVTWRSRRRDRSPDRQSVNLFLVYALVVSFGIGFLQREIWPFSNWPLVAGVHPPVARHPRLVAVDRLGREHEVDYRAWEPFVFDELIAWADLRLTTLGPREAAEAGKHLLRLAEEGRQRAARGGAVGYVDRFWGPLTAPYFLLHPDRWVSPVATPSEPFVGLRFYIETWNLDERLADPTAVERELAYEYLRP